MLRSQLLSRAINSCAGRVTQHYLSAASAEEGERIVSDISVVGSNLFRDEVAESIHLLKSKYPFGYSLVRRYVKAIIAFPRRVDFGVVEGVCFEVPQTDGGLAWRVNRFAALLFRSAILVRLSRHGICVFRNSQVQSVAWRAELRCMEKLGCHPDYIKQQKDYLKTNGSA